MNPTQYADINQLLEALLENIKAVLKEKLVGLYLYGSLVWGDFDHEISDIDLLAATLADLDSTQLVALQKMHELFARQNPKWDNRIEVQYCSLKGLKTFRSQRTQMAVISPGEPFHLIDAGEDWLTNWYFVQDHGVTLFGVAPAQLIDPISKEEFIRAVYDHAIFWRKHVGQTMHSRPYQSYAILTMCRALYTVTHGEQVSKKKAANWAKGVMPEFSGLIEKAMFWRANAGIQPDQGDEATFPEVEKFVHNIVDRIIAFKR